MQKRVGGTHIFEVVLTQELEVLAILKVDGCKKFSLFLKGGGGGH